MHYIILSLMSSILLLTSGCAGQRLNPDGTVMVVPPISAFQVRLLASTTMGAAILAEKIPLEQLALLKSVFSAMNASTLILLKEEIQILEGEALLTRMREQYAIPLGPYYPVAEGVLGLMITSIRPLIDQGQTDLAASYIDATFSGAMSALDSEIRRLTTSDLGVRL